MDVARGPYPSILDRYALKLKPLFLGSGQFNNAGQYGQYPQGAAAPMGWYPQGYPGYDASGYGSYGAFGGGYGSYGMYPGYPAGYNTGYGSYGGGYGTGKSMLDCFKFFFVVLYFPVSTVCRTQAEASVCLIDESQARKL